MACFCEMRIKFSALSPFNCNIEPKKKLVVCGEDIVPRSNQKLDIKLYTHDSVQYDEKLQE